jgi:hypothetical protein
MGDTASAFGNSPSRFGAPTGKPVEDRMWQVNHGRSELVTINKMVDMIEDGSAIRVKRQYKPDGPLGVRGRNSDNTMIKEIYGWDRQSGRLTAQKGPTTEFMTNRPIVTRRSWPIKNSTLSDQGSPGVHTDPIGDGG